MKNESKGSILYVIITVLCCMVAAGTALLVEASQDDKKFVQKVELSALCDRLAKLETENREDHKSINKSLQQILMEIGRIQGYTEGHDAP